MKKRVLESRPSFSEKQKSNKNNASDNITNKGKENRGTKRRMDNEHHSESGKNYGVYY